MLLSFNNLHRIKEIPPFTPRGCKWGAILIVIRIKTKIWYNICRMKVNRNKIHISKVPKNDDDNFAKIPPAERISFMWELTAELWSLRKSPYVERRLQRNVTNFIKQ